MDRTVFPKIHSIEHVDMLDPDQLVLPNDVRLFAFSGISEPVIQMEFTFAAGARFSNHPLVSKLTLDLLLEGAGGKSALEVMNALDELGAYIQTSAGKTRSSLVVYSTIRNLEPVLDIVQTILESPNLQQSDFEILRDNDKQSYVVDSEKVSSLARREFATRVFGGHPFGNVTRLEDFDSVSVDQCKAFYQAHISGRGMTVFAAGAIDEEVAVLLENHIGQWRFSALEATDIQSVNPPSAAHYNVHKEGAIQCGIRMGTTSINREHPDFVGLQVLMTVFGGYFGSRLMMNIREDKGYTYGIGAGLVSYGDTGLIYVATEVGAEYEENTFKEIYSEVNMLRTDLIPEKELNLVKNYMKGSFVRSSDGAFQMMERFKMVHFSGLDLSYYDRYLATLTAISSQDLLVLANRYLRHDDWVKISAGPRNS